MRARPFTLALAVLCLMALPGGAVANGDDEMPGRDNEIPGRTLVEESCARCHAIEKTGESPFALAPPLRELADKYPLEGLEEAFAEGIVVGHPAMPEFELDPDQIDDLIGYLEWLGE